MAVSSTAGSSQPLLGNMGPTKADKAAAASPGLVGNAEAEPLSRRAVHEEDAEDSAVDVLPPVYKEAWAERR